MAAGIEEPSGKAAGRVTIVATLVSLLPPFAAVLVVVVCFLVGILNAETAGAVILGILATAGLTTGTVFTAAKKTPTDQARLIWGSAPVTDVVTPPVAPLDPEPVADELTDVELEDVPPPATLSLADEVAAVRPTGSTAA